MSEINHFELAGLLEAASLKDIEEKASRLVHALGYDTFVAGVQHAGQILVVSTYSQTWRTIYDKQNLIEKDPTVLHARRSTLPLVWHPGLFKQKEAASLLEQSRSYGITSGLSIPVHGSNGSAAMTSFASGREFGDAQQRHAQENLPASMLLSTYLFEAIQRIGSTTPGETDGEETAEESGIYLTPKETECLKWSAAGKSSWEIGTIMSCTERTINFHFGNIIKKLGVSNRRMAVAKAIATKLVSI
ncbi:MAG: LuxR family transcriptional regulator [Gammaproteobacteria bacterium]|nr:LuxR family transcriptional regulator [Gammaproteobacteria bacterium]